MTDSRIKPCRSCGADVIFISTRAGKSMPINADTARPEDELFDHTRHKSHFSTCPKADKHRNPR